MTRRLLRALKALNFFYFVAFGGGVFFAHKGQAAQGIVYHGRVLRSDGAAFEASTAEFRVQFRSPGSENCLMYEETKAIDMAGSKGVFTFNVNAALGTRTDQTGYSLAQVFSNRSSFAFTHSECESGTSYAPASTDSRKFVLSFRESQTGTWESLGAEEVQYAPVALEALQIGGYGANHLCRIENASGTPASVSAITDTQWTELLALIAGTSSKYLNKSSGSAATLPSYSSGSPPSSPSAGSIWFDSGSSQIKYYNGTSVQTIGAPVSDSTKVNKAGDTMTGSLVLPSNGLSVGTNQLVVSGGNVSIGATSAGNKFFVLGSGKFEAQSSDTYTAVYSGNAVPWGSNLNVYETWSIDNNYVGVDFLVKNATGNNQHGFVGVVSNSGGGVYAPSMVLGLSTGSNAYAEYVRINNTGNVGIGVTAPAYALDVAGDINSSSCFRIGATTVSGTCTSDRRLKEDVRDFTGGLADLLGLRIRTYRFNGLGGMPKTGEWAVGLIAQEVEKTNPDLVKLRRVKLRPSDLDETEIKAVDYSKFIYMLINAIKEVYGKMTDLDRSITTELSAKASWAEVESVRKTNNQLIVQVQKLEQENAEFKRYLCRQDPHASFCPRSGENDGR